MTPRYLGIVIAGGCLGFGIAQALFQSAFGVVLHPQAIGGAAGVALFFATFDHLGKFTEQTKQ